MKRIRFKRRTAWASVLVLCFCTYGPVFALESEAAHIETPTATSSDALLDSGNDNLPPPVADGEDGLIPSDISNKDDLISADTSSRKPIPPPENWISSGGKIAELTPLEISSPLTTAYGDETFADLRAALSFTGIDCIWQRGEERYALCLSISWEFAALNAFLPYETQTLTGKVILPEGTELANDVNGDVSIPIKVDAAATIELVSFEKEENIRAIAFAQNQQDKLTQWFDGLKFYVTAYDKDGNRYQLFVENFDISQIDISQPGIYTATALPTVDARYTLAEGVVLPRTRHLVSVQKIGQPEINLSFFSQGSLQFPWVLSDEQDEQPELFSVWLREQNGEWACLDENSYGINKGGLQLYPDILESGKSYELQVDYPGGQTGILSFSYDGALRILDYIHGNRDGGGDGTELPDVMQPPPNQGNSSTPQPPDSGDSDSTDGDNNNTPPTTSPQPSDQHDGNGGNTGADNGTPPPSNEQIPPPQPPPALLPSGEIPSGNSLSIEDVPDGQNEEITYPAPSKEPEQTDSAAVSKDAPPMERDTADGLILSGLRLNALCALNDDLVVSKNGIILRLSSVSLQGLALKDEDSFSITLTKPASDTVLLDASVNDQPLSAIPNTMVEVDYAPRQRDGVISVTHESGEPVAVVQVEHNTVRYTVEQTGAYTISEAIPAATAAQTPRFYPWIPAAVTGGLLTLAAGIFLWRRRRMP